MKYEKLILNIPHASVNIPTEDNSYINENEKLETIYYLTDFFTDDLFDISLKTVTNLYLNILELSAISKDFLKMKKKQWHKKEWDFTILRV